MGLFVTFEGIEGSGKTTQIAFAGDFLRSQGVPCVVTSEPGGSALGGELRRLLLESGAPSIAERAELFLFAADRAQHVDEVILPGLKEGKVVLCDRYCDATIAYQGYGRGLDRDMIDQVNSYAARSLKPHCTLLFDMPPEEGLHRVRHRAVDSSLTEGSQDRFEQERLAFHRRVRQGYLALAEEEPHRFRIVDAAAGMEEVSEKVRNILSEIRGS